MLAFHKIQCIYLGSFIVSSVSIVSFAFGICSSPITETQVLYLAVKILQQHSLCCVQAHDVCVSPGDLEKKALKFKGTEDF